MARPSKLSPPQWVEVERRLLAGETARALGREFGISEAAIRKRFGAHQSVSAQSAHVRSVAEKLAVVNAALEGLPVSQRGVAIDLAATLRNITSSLVASAELAAKTSHRLHALANSQIAKVDDAEPFSPESLGALKGVGVLTKLANDSASTPLNLLAANKETVKGMNSSGDEAQSGLPVKSLSTEALAEIMRAKDAAGRV